MIKKACEICGNEFFSRFSRAMRCSPECKEAGRVKQYKESILTPKYHYNRNKSAAKHRDKPFTLTLEDFTKLLWRKPCHYCGNPLNASGIDRIDSKLGYHRDNVVPCCAACNGMKYTLSQTEFINQAIKVAEYNKIKRLNPVLN